MIDKEVIPAFDMLLEELERIIPELNRQGKNLLDLKHYSEAHELIDKAQAVVAFEDKVRDLRAEWIRMNVPPVQKQMELPGKTKTARKHTTKLKKGQRTREDHFRIPILKALVDLGGKARVREVIKKLESIMASELNTIDWQSVSSDKKVIRWQNTAMWERFNMVQEGLLANNSPKGIWEITSAGRMLLETTLKDS